MKVRSSIGKNVDIYTSSDPKPDESVKARSSVGKKVDDITSSDPKLDKSVKVRSSVGNNVDANTSSDHKPDESVKDRNSVDEKVDANTSLDPRLDESVKGRSTIGKNLEANTSSNPKLEVQLTVEKSAPLRELMDSYCNQMGLHTSQVEFSIDDQPIARSDTAESLAIWEGDAITRVSSKPLGKIILAVSTFSKHCQRHPIGEIFVWTASLEGSILWARAEIRCVRNSPGRTNCCDTLGSVRREKNYSRSLEWHALHPRNIEESLLSLTAPPFL